MRFNFQDIVIYLFLRNNHERYCDLHEWLLSSHIYQSEGNGPSDLPPLSKSPPRKL